MRYITRGVLAAALVALAAASAPAQQPPRPGGGGFGGFGFGGGGGGGGGFNLKSLLVSNKALQDELKVSDEMREKFAKFQDAQRADQEKLRGLGTDDEDQITRLKAQIKGIEDRMALMKDLTADQTKRISQIERQMLGLGAFTNEKIVKELKLSDEQKEKIKGINEELGKDTRELFAGGGGGFNPDTQKKMAALREEAMDKAEEALTPAQRKQWKEMLGEKFDTTKLFTPMRRNN